MFQDDTSKKTSINKRSRINLRYKRDIVLYKKKHNVTISVLASKFSTTEDIVRSVYKMKIF